MTGRPGIVNWRFVETVSGVAQTTSAGGVTLAAALGLALAVAVGVAEAVGVADGGRCWPWRRGRARAGVA